MTKRKLRFNNKENSFSFIEDSIFLSQYFHIWKYLIAVIICIFLLEDFPNLFTSQIDAETILILILVISAVLFICRYLIKKIMKIIDKRIETKEKIQQMLPSLFFLLILIAGLLGLLAVFQNVSIIFFLNSIVDFHESLSKIDLMPYSNNVLLKYLFILLAWAGYVCLIVYVKTWKNIYKTKEERNLRKLKENLMFSLDSSTVPDEIKADQSFKLKLLFSLSSSIKLRKIKSRSSMLQINEIQPDFPPPRTKKDRDIEFFAEVKPNSCGDSTFSLRVYAFIPKVFYQIGRVLYLFPGSFLETKKFNISIYPNQPKIEIKTTYEPIAATEKRFSIAIEAKNTGIGIARDLIFNLDFQDGISMVDDFRFVPILIPRQEEAKRFITLVSNVLGRFQFSLNVSYKDKAGYNYTLPDQISFEIEFVKNRQSVKPNPKIRTVTLASSPSIRSTLFEDIEKKINEVLTSSKIQLNSYFGAINEDIMKQILNYKKRIEEYCWKIASKFKREKQFHDDIFSYLNEEERFPDIIIKEREIASGKVDLTVLEVPIELKLDKIGDDFERIIASNYQQLQQYCSDLNSTFGFLAILTTHLQEAPYFRKAEDIRLKIIRGGDFPIILVSILIRGGKKISPSKL